MDRSLVTAKYCGSFFIFLIACIANAQWVADGPPDVLEYQFITTGGITYFRLVARIPTGSCCQRTAGYDVARDGSALSQIIEHETWEGPCIDILCAGWREEFVSVLGALPPGNYTLTLLAGRRTPPLVSPWASLPFTVPTHRTSTLSVSATNTTNGATLLVQVAAVSNVLYALQCSTNFTNWSAIKTNLGAPVSFSASITNRPRSFYRAEIFQAPSRRLP